jgi:hypothetical protein
MPLDNADFDAPPVFCPLCKQARDAGEVLCRACGEQTVLQGYCDVCEDHWLLPAGRLCPKHDLKLLDQPWESHGADEGEPLGRLVTIGTYSRPAEAEVLRIRLQAEGIPTFIQGERMGSASMYAVATGGVKLQVPQSHASDARILLSQSWAPPAVEDDLDDAWEELAPEPGARRRLVMKALVLLVLFGPLVMFALMRLLGSE